MFFLMKNLYRNEENNLWNLILVALEKVSNIQTADFSKEIVVFLPFLRVKF